MPRLRILLIMTVVLFTFGTVVKADEVQLKNGDRLTGDVVKMEGGIITFKTSHSGEVKINFGEIQSLTTSNPITVQTTDESKLKGILKSPSPGTVTVTSPDYGTTSPIALSTISAINPPSMINFDGTFNLGGTVNKGNSDSKAINGSALYSLRAERHRVSIEGKYNYGEQNPIDANGNKLGKQISVRNALAALKYDFFLTKQLYANAFTDFESDTIQNLSLRSTVGAGLGYQFFDTNVMQLSGELGLAYINQDWKDPIKDDHSIGGRWAVNFNYALIPDRLIFFHRHEGLRDLDVPHGTRIRADQGFRVPLYKQFALNLEYDVKYNSKPAPGRQSTDYTYIIGVSYTLPK